jgi:hypothetical protein
VSWWWGAATLALVVAAGLAARTARRVEAERSALGALLGALDPLRDEAVELRSRLLRTAGDAAARRRRLEAQTARRRESHPMAGEPDGRGPRSPRRGRQDTHR